MRYHFLYFSFFLACFPQIHTLIAAPTDIWLNVVIHGTVGLRSQLNFSTFIHLMKDQIEETTYKKVVEQLRSDPYFFKIQAIHDLGLHYVEEPCENSCSAASLFAKAFQKNLASPSSIKNLYYTFGWSGLLSVTERARTAGLLSTALTKEIKKWQRFYPKRKIHLRLIGYSHGGSVALHMAQVHEHALVVDELLLVGTPIQKETDFLVHDPMFKKIYNFYSRKDFIQKMDCFSLNRFFSHRRFKKDCLSDKLVQVELKIMGSKYPGSKRYHIDRSPSHTELWFFGWTLQSYRKKFLTYPLPISAFLPTFIRTINDCMPDKKHIILTLYPDGHAQVKERHSRERCSVQWIDPRELQELKDEILRYAPISIDSNEHEAHMRCAQKATLDGLRKLQAKYDKKYKKRAKHSCDLCGAGLYEIP